MTLEFPSSPTNDQVYENYIYNSTVGAWQKLPGNTFADAAISDTPPVNPNNGDLWWNSADGQFYVYYNDGSSAQWVSASMPSVAVSDTPPAGYEGQLWLDSTDGSMYVYYTDPGGASSSWIGAVSRSGGILQVVQTQTSSITTTASTSYVDTALAGTITPRSTSSKIMVIAMTASLVQNGSTANNFAQQTIFRGNSATGIDLGLGSMAEVYLAGTAANVSPSTITVLDSPATTSSVTYTVGIRCRYATTTAQAKNHQNMILMEVAG